MLLEKEDATGFLGQSTLEKSPKNDLSFSVNATR